jgi:hypothetical protein
VLLGNILGGASKFGWVFVECGAKRTALARLGASKLALFATSGGSDLGDLQRARLLCQIPSFN